MKWLLIPFAVYATLAISCTKRNSSKTNFDIVNYPAGDCGNGITMDEASYNTAQMKEFGIHDVSISGDCLNIIFISTHTCSVERWNIKLFASGKIAESYPPQRYLKVSGENKDLCAAATGGTLTFNLKPLQIPGSNKLALNLYGWNKPVVYSY